MNLNKIQLFGKYREVFMRLGIPKKAFRVYFFPLSFFLLFFFISTIAFQILSYPKQSQFSIWITEVSLSYFLGGLFVFTVFLLIKNYEKIYRRPVAKKIKVCWKIFLAILITSATITIATKLLTLWVQEQI